MRYDFSTDAPLSAEDSAAQIYDPIKDSFDFSTHSTNADFVRPKLRMVSNGVPYADEDDEEADLVPQREPEDENWFDSIKAFEARLEARMDGGYGNSIAPFLAVAENGKDDLRANEAKIKTKQAQRQTAKTEPRYPGLKKLTIRQIAQDLPPTPRGCEWRRSDDGLNLWRCWTERDGDKAQKIKKSRYAGTLSQDAWQIMKEYDHEAFISTVGERLRRHGRR